MGVSRGRGRPGLPEDQKRRRRTITVTNAVWRELKALAAGAGLRSRSRYIEQIACPPAQAAPADRPEGVSG